MLLYFEPFCFVFHFVLFIDIDIIDRVALKLDQKTKG